jgi:Arc/MetJ-type ribon-helix-helix transcriptional regulator
MQLRLNKPELARFVDEKVKAGEFPSPEAVIEDALTRMMQDEQLTEEDVEAVNSSDEQIEHGEVVQLDEFADRIRRKHKSA